MINSLQLQIDPQSKLPPFGMAPFQRQQLTRFDKRGNLTIVLTLETHDVCHISMREIVGGVVRHRVLL